MAERFQRELEDELEAERRHARLMAEAFRFLAHGLEEDRRAVIAIRGTQLTVGDVVDGLLAQDIAHRAKAGDE